MKDRFDRWGERYDWSAHAAATLRWLYGADHERERQAKTLSDLEAWRRLGDGRRPAA